MEEEKPRKDMNWGITWKVLLVNLVAVTAVVVLLQKLFWPADEWQCRNNIITLNKAVVKYNRANPAAMLVEDLTEPDPKTKKSYIDQVLVKGGFVKEGGIVNPMRKNERGEDEETHYYFLGEVAHSWDLYYTGLRVTRQLPDGPKAMNVAVKCNAHEMNSMSIELLGILILAGIASIFTWSFMGYSLPFKDEEEGQSGEPQKQ
jgi:hypothetical protein